MFQNWLWSFLVLIFHLVFKSFLRSAILTPPYSSLASVYIKMFLHLHFAECWLLLIESVLFSHAIKLSVCMSLEIVSTLWSKKFLTMQLLKAIMCRNWKLQTAAPPSGSIKKKKLNKKNTVWLTAVYGDELDDSHVFFGLFTCDFQMLHLNSNMKSKCPIGDVLVHMCTYHFHILKFGFTCKTENMSFITCTSCTVLIVHTKHFSWHVKRSFSHINVYIHM